MNRKAQLVFVGIMIASVVFIMVVSLLSAMQEQASAARVALSCGNTSLSAGEAGTCIVTDTFLFAWVGTALAVGLGFIGARRLIAGGGA